MTRRTRIRVTVACLLVDLAVIVLCAATGRAPGAAIAAGVGLVFGGAYLVTRPRRGAR